MDMCLFRYQGKNNNIRAYIEMSGGRVCENEYSSPDIFLLFENVHFDKE
jgi:hypothetical protein